MKNFVIIFSLGCVGLIFQACEVYYVPNTQNVPLFKERNELRATISGQNYQAAYSLTDHIGIMLNGQYINRKWDINEDSVKSNFISEKFLIEGGMGYFNKIGNNGVFETYAGGGEGYATFNRITPSKRMEMSADFSRFFIQPSIGYSEDVVDVAFSLRYVGLKFFNIDTTGYTPSLLSNYNLIIPNLHNTWYNFLEPALTIRVGYKYAKFHMQFLYSQKLNNEPLNYVPFRINLGLHINIAQRFKSSNN